MVGHMRTEEEQSESGHSEGSDEDLEAQYDPHAVVRVYFADCGLVYNTLEKPVGH